MAVFTAVFAEVVFAPPGPVALVSLTMTPFELILFFIFYALLLCWLTTLLGPL